MQDVGAMPNEQLEWRRDLAVAASTHIVQRGREMLTQVEQEAASQVEEVRQEAEVRLNKQGWVAEARALKLHFLHEDNQRARVRLEEEYAMISYMVRYSNSKKSTSSTEDRRS